MVRAILRALKQIAKKLCPNRFDTHQVWVAQPVDDHELWRKLLSEVRDMFVNSAIKTLVLQPGHEIYNQIAHMVPWELTRVQLAMAPITRRMPRHIAFTHRGAALLHNDQTMSLEWEDLSNITFPKQRFGKPVNAAIFFFSLPDPHKPSSTPAGREADATIQTHDFQFQVSAPTSPIRMRPRPCPRR